MIGSFLTRALVLAFGYAYPAYECFKIVELDKPNIDQLRFWCQYWILVAGLTVFERVGDTFVGWIPFYGESKLAFFLYLWLPNTKGTTYVYDSFFRPYVAKHETEIDRNLLEWKLRAADMALFYWQKAASNAQTVVFDILKYIASQSYYTTRATQPYQQGNKVKKAIAPLNQNSAAASPSAKDEPPTSISSSSTDENLEDTAAEEASSRIAMKNQKNIASDYVVISNKTSTSVDRQVLKSDSGNDDQSAGLSLRQLILEEDGRAIKSRRGARGGVN